MADELLVALRDPAASNPEDGITVLPMAFGGSLSDLADDQEVVAIYAFFENPPTNQVAVEHSGHEILGANTKGTDKAIVTQRDTGGNDDGQLRTYTAGAAQGPQRTINKSVASTVCAQGVSYQVYEGGDGNDYDDALVQARIEAGFPP